MYVTCFKWVLKTSNCTGSQSLSYDCKLIKFYEINSVSLFISYVLAVCIYLCAEVGGRIPTFDFRYKKLKMLPFIVTNVGKDGTFRAYSCFLTMDSFRFEEIASGNGSFQEI